MLRKIIEINEELCDGCGECVTDCSEGALQIIDGKARLVKEQFCDGFGDCVGACPTGALEVVEKDTEEFDLQATAKYLADTQGIEAVWRMTEAQKKHHVREQTAHADAHQGGGCPGSRMKVSQKTEVPKPVDSVNVAQAIPSELNQWPIQLHLVHPAAPFFKDKELVFMSTCGPIASADVHWRFLRGRSVIVGCPKLDDVSNYAAKLGMILEEPSIPRVHVVRMEVPCCGGLTSITQEAARLSGRDDIEVVEHTLGTDGSMNPPKVVSSGASHHQRAASY